MNFQVTLTRPSEIAGLGGSGFSDKAYLKFCQQNPDLQVERSARGGIVIVPPAGFESEDRNMEIIAQLRTWAKKNGRGRVSGPTAQFFLPDGSALSPGAAWTSNKLLNRASYQEKRRFPYLCPEFIVEVLSPSDRLSEAKLKMEQWVANGAQLSWLIDADRQNVYIYQPGHPVETRKGIARMAGAGPVKGFVLELRAIWKGLK